MPALASADNELAASVVARPPGVNAFAGASACRCVYVPARPSYLVLRAGEAPYAEGAPRSQRLQGPAAARMDLFNGLFNGLLDGRARCSATSAPPHVFARAAIPTEVTDVVVGSR